MSKALEERKAEREERLGRAQKFAEEAAKALSRHRLGLWLCGQRRFQPWVRYRCFARRGKASGAPFGSRLSPFPVGTSRGGTAGPYKGGIQNLEKKDAQLLYALKDRILLRDDLRLEPLLFLAVQELP